MVLIDKVQKASCEFWETLLKSTEQTDSGGGEQAINLLIIFSIKFLVHTSLENRIQSQFLKAQLDDIKLTTVQNQNIFSLLSMDKEKE